MGRGGGGVRVVEAPVRPPLPRARRAGPARPPAPAQCTHAGALTLLPAPATPRPQARGKPYVVVFCGVNGVGKSTNLAKIAYWLGQHGVKVMIAACDTFRAGERKGCSG